MGQGNDKQRQGLLWDSNARLLAVAVSATNLTLLPLWRVLIYAEAPDEYFLAAAAWHDHVAAILILVFVSAITFASLKAVLKLRRLQSWLLFALLGGVFVKLLNFLRVMATQFGLSGDTANLLFVGLLGVTALLFLLFQQRVLSIIFGFFLVLSPFAAMTATQALFRASPEPPTLAGEIIRPGRVSEDRVVWVIFDELDRRFLFGERRSDFSYPAFDELREHSVHLSRAVPIGVNTITALPGYWIGERVERTIRRDDRQIELQIEGTEVSRSLDEFDHVFKAAWRQGARIGSTGFYHPYCRLFSQYMSACTEFFYHTVLHRQTNSVGDSVRLSIAALTPLWRRLSVLRIVEDSRLSMLEQVGDPELDFVAIHLMMPHMPAVYDPMADRLRMLPFGLDYPDNIAKADRLLAELVQQLRDSGTWDRTHLIVTSDHGASGMNIGKMEPGAVPLLIRMAGQDAPISIDDEVDMVVIREIILGLLSGEIGTPPILAQRLRARVYEPSIK